MDERDAHQGPHGESEHVIHYTVDNEPQTTRERELTAGQILRQAGIDPDTHYLIEIRGHDRESFKDRTDAEIRMHDHLKFISIAVGPTPVS